MSDARRFREWVMDAPPAETYAQTIVPTVIKKTSYGERGYDIFSRLLKDRIIFLGSEIDDSMANVIVAQLLFLQMENRTQEISVYINSPGGSVSAGLAIYDTIQFVEADVAKIGRAHV